MRGGTKEVNTRKIGRERTASCTVIGMDNASLTNNPEPLRLHLQTRLAELGFERLAEATDRLTEPDTAAVSELVPS